MSDTEKVSCTIFNGTSRELGRLGELQLEYRQKDLPELPPGHRRGNCMTSCPSLPPNQATEINFPMESLFNGPKTDPATCMIVIKKVGYLLFPGAVQSALVTPGGQYRIEEDPENRAVSAAEAHLCIQLLTHALQFNYHIPAYEEKHSLLQSRSDERDEPVSDKIWRWIAAKIGRNPEDDVAIKTMQKSFEEFVVSLANIKPTWYHDPCRPRVATLPNCSEKNHSLFSVPDSKFDVVIYHRALERFPGGNADMFVLKHHFVYRNQTARLVSAQRFSNWDAEANYGDLTSSESNDYRVAVSKRCQSTLIPNLIKFFQEGAYSSSLVQDGNSTKPKPTGTQSWSDRLVYVDDDRTDSDEFDTQWSSIEILLFSDFTDETKRKETWSLPASVPETKSLLFRLHQVAKYSQDTAYQCQLIAAEAVPISHFESSLIQAATDTVDVGSPMQFSEGNVTANEALKCTRYDRCSYTYYAMPLHFYF